MKINGWYEQDVNAPVIPKQLEGRLFAGNSNANRIGIILTDGNSPAEIESGATCIGEVYRSDGYNVPITGTIDGNRASFVLTDAAYSVEGRAVIHLSIVANEDKTTVLCLTGTVAHTSDGNYIDPVPVDYTMVLAAMAQMQSAISDAQDATTAAQEATTAAQEAAEDVLNIAVRYDATQSLTDVQKAQARGNIGAADADDINGIESAIDSINSDLYDFDEQTIDETLGYSALEFSDGYISNTGATGGAGTYKHTKKIAVNEGDVITYIVNSVPKYIRFVCAYDGESVKSGKGSSSEVTSFTVPAGVTHIVCSLTDTAIDPYGVLHRVYTTRAKTFDVSAYVRGLAEDGIESIPDAIDALEDKIDEITETVSHSETDVTEPQFTLTDGYYWWNGAVANSIYSYTILDVIPGDVVQCLVRSTGQVKTMRFVDAYNGNTRVPASSKENVNAYTVPNGVNKIYISAQEISTWQYKFVISHTTVTETTMPKGVEELNVAVERVIKKGFVLSTEAASLAANTNLILIGNLDNRMNGRIDLWCNFSAFDTVTVGHGTSSYGGYLVVDATNVSVYYNGSVVQNYAHGLAISGFIEIHIKQGNNARATFSVSTADGTWTSAESAQWHGCRGSIFAKATMALSNIRLSAQFPDMKKDVFIFGDSYTSLGDTSRWPYYVLNTYSAANMAIFGYGGVGAADEIMSFRNAIQMIKPYWAAWFIGMNDGDSSSAINANWKQYTDEFIATCEQYGIIPILATIPCTPTVNNTYKNAYVRASGHAYVDFAKAVNGETAGASWYAGMLHSDNVHPTALGAKALAARLMADLPQIQ